MAMPIRAIITMTDTSLIRLMTWLSPSFPVGGFAWSGGLEAACLNEAVATREDLREWISAGLNHGPLRNDAILLAATHRGDDELVAINDLALALAGSRERYAETTGLGDAFTAAAGPWRGNAALQLPKPVAYPVAVGQVAAENTIPLSDTLAAFLNAVVTAQIQAALRLMALGQQAGVELLAELETMVKQQSGLVADSSLDDLGFAAVNMDIASMKHETLASRIFRS